MKAEYSLILTCRDGQNREFHARGIFRVHATYDLRKATNFRLVMWPLRWLALRNFKRGYPKFMQSHMQFEKIIFLSGKIDTMFG